LHATPAWPLDDDKAAARVRNLWQRMMNPGSGVYAPGDSPWDDLHTILKNQKPVRTAGILSPPHAPVSAAYTLERGRILLEAADLLPRRARTIAASLDVVTDYTNHGSGTWPSALDFAHEAAGIGQLSIDIHRRIADAHQAATPGAPAGATAGAANQRNEPPQTTQQQAAQQRFGALTGSPILQRLFGLALDVHVLIEKIESAAGADKLVWIAIDERCWTLARIDKSAGAGFHPSGQNEAETPSGMTWRAMRYLGLKNNHQPRYDVCTIDPTLAVTNAWAQAFNGSPPTPSLPDLHNGGIRLLDCAPETTIDMQIRADSDNQSKATGGKTVLLEADTIAVSDRLLIGLITDRGMQWRSPLYRSIRYQDPEPPHSWPKHWVEDELTDRGLGAQTSRRMELDAAELHQPVVDVHHKTGVS
jgi:hypothetical protein